MWDFMFGREGSAGDIIWESQPGMKLGVPQGDGLLIAILPRNKPESRFAALNYAAEMVRKTKKLTWIHPGNDRWVFDFDSAREVEPKLPKTEWLRGKLRLVPDFEVDNRRFTSVDTLKTYDAGITFYIMPETIPKVQDDLAVTRKCYGGRWEVVKELTTEGQGTILIVYDKTKGRPADVIYRAALESLETAVNGVHSAERENAILDAAQQFVELSARSNGSDCGALKFIKLENPRDPDEAKKRMRDEILAMSELEHPSLLALYDKNLDSDDIWYVSEYHTRGTLKTRQQEFKGNVQATLQAMRPLIDGVARIHEKGMIHRDIKPDNIFVSESNRLVLGDFGLVYTDKDDEERVSFTG